MMNLYEKFNTEIEVDNSMHKFSLLLIRRKGNSCFFKKCVLGF